MRHYECMKHYIILSNIFYRTYGPPKILQGSEFKGEVKKFLEKLNIEVRKGKPYYPQSHGKCERSHGTWKEKIRFDLSRNIDTGK